jgi:uroporphyrinogen-III decarboxylase
MSDNNLDSIKSLMDKVREISEEKANKKRIERWQPSPETARDHWRGKPQWRASIDSAPITVEPEMAMWGEIMGFALDEFYQNPLVYLEYQLRMMIWRYENFDDHTCIEKNVPIWLGTTFESSLFGSKTIYDKSESPWLDREFVIGNESDFYKIQKPDFNKTGLMPLSHKYYEVLKETLDDDFNVTFPEWGRSPFAVATHIRGFENVLIDLVSNPDFAKELIRFITDVRIEWTKERAHFLGMGVEKGNIYNDEVNTPTLSPQLYEEFALPYEIELSKFHGGILYWHSCGNTTALMTSIAKIPDLEMFHVGPWTDLKTAMDTFKGELPLEICIHPLKYVQNADENAMRSNLQEINEICGDSPYTIRAEGLQKFTTVNEDVKHIKDWIRIANETSKN